MPQRMTIMLVAVGLVFAAIFGFEAFRARMIQKAIVSMRNPQQTVSTITAGTQDWQDRLEAVGSTRAEKGADLSPQVSGIVKAIHFQSGEKVEQGAMLVELEDADDIAKLQALEATAALAQLNYDRASQLLKTDAVSQETVDTDFRRSRMPGRRSRSSGRWSATNRSGRPFPAGSASGRSILASILRRARRS